MMNSLGHWVVRLGTYYGFADESDSGCSCQKLAVISIRVRTVEKLSKDGRNHHKKLKFSLGNTDLWSVESECSTLS